jgi:hypothetical protein
MIVAEIYEPFAEVVLKRLVTEIARMGAESSNTFGGVRAGARVSRQAM